MQMELPWSVLSRLSPVIEARSPSSPVPVGAPSVSKNTIMPEPSGIPAIILMTSVPEGVVNNLKELMFPLELIWLVATGKSK